jgi:capsular exopolysaccharide synthesis family protein
VYYLDANSETRIMGEISEALRRAKGDGTPAAIPRQPARDRHDPVGDPDSGHEHDDEDSTTPLAPSPPSPPPKREVIDPESQPPSQPSAIEVHDISRENGKFRAERITLLDPMTPAAVGARRLAQQVKRQARLRGMRSIVVTSSLSGDGKTTVSCNLAISLTSLDRSRSVVLVDLDLRRPSVAESLSLRVRHGVDEVLAKEVSVNEALLRTNVPGLSVLAVGSGTSNPESLLASKSLTSLIRSLEKRFSMVILDTPPILSVADATSVVDVADGCLLVVRSGHSPTASVRSAIEHLPAEKMLGCCLNFARDSQPVANYEYYPVAPVRETGSDDSPEEPG